MKKFASHAVSFLAGLGLGFLLATKACPPTPAPVDTEIPKVEIKVPVQESQKDEKPVIPQGVTVETKAVTVEVKPEAAK